MRMFSKRTRMATDGNCPDYDCLLKFIVVGRVASGKSGLLRRFADDEFSDSYVHNQCADFKIRNLPMEDFQGHRVKLQLWENKEAERFRTDSNSCYQGAHAAIVVYDITDEQSFKSARIWFDEVDYFTNSVVAWMLVGNKCDLTTRVVSYEQGKELADSRGIPFIETSAKTSENIQELFFDLAHTVLVKKEIINVLAKSARSEGQNVDVPSSSESVANSGEEFFSDKKSHKCTVS